MKDMKVSGGILLVSGTTIGAAMLALPIVTGFAGFFPSVILFIFLWAYMTFTAFLILEVNLWMGEHTNLITMAKKTLGTTGQVVSWIIYLFLLYTLTTAYMAGSGPIFIDLIKNIFNFEIPIWFGPIPLLLVFGYFVYQGAHFVDYANRFLMVGLALTFVALIVLITPHIHPVFLERSSWPSLITAVSIVSTSFGFHIIIPTLTDYLNRDIAKVRQAILIGSIIPLVVYIIWEGMTLGAISLEGDHGLAEGYGKGLDGASLMSLYLKKTTISQIAAFFSLFAIVTSFLGVSLSLRDFLADGLKIRKDTQGRLTLYLLTFAPPLLLTLTDPRAFLNALEYAGAFGVVTLLGILPVLMVWKGRYQQHRPSEFTVPGGKTALIAAFIISVFIIGLGLVNRLD